MSAPPGIEIVFYGILIGFSFAAASIAYGIGFLMSRLLKVRVGAKGVIVIAVLFLLSFWASSHVIQQREVNQTVYLWGYPTPYQGDFVYYGFPVVWYRMFETYDISQRYLFAAPSITNVFNFFVDLTVWMAIPVILIYSGKSLGKHMHLGAI